MARMRIPKDMVVMTNGAGERAVTHADAARLKGVTRQAISEAVKANELPSERVHDRLKLITLEDLRKYKVSRHNQVSGRGARPKKRRAVASA